MFWINSTSDNKEFFYIIRNVLNDALLEELEQYVKQHDLLQPAKFITDEADGDQNPNVRVTEIAWIDTRSNSDLYSKLTAVTTKANHEYFNFILTYIETLQYSVYPPGGHYKCHADAALKGINGDARKLSFSIGLNDEDEYQGGELEIWTGGDNKIFKLHKYEMVLFPSWIPHQVHPITKGTRKSLVGWIHGPDFT
jgi:PKHD-type hydroxylase